MSSANQVQSYRVDAERGVWMRHLCEPQRYMYDTRGFSEQPTWSGILFRRSSCSQTTGLLGSTSEVWEDPHLVNRILQVWISASTEDLRLFSSMKKFIESVTSAARTSSTGPSAVQIGSLPNVSIGDDDAEVVEQLGATADTLAVITELRRHSDSGTIRVEADGDPECPTPIRVLMSTGTEAEYLAAEEALEQFDEDYWLHQPAETRGMISVHIA